MKLSKLYYFIEEFYTIEIDYLLLENSLKKFDILILQKKV